MFVVDTNVLLYAAEKHFPGHARCRALLEEWRRRSSVWYTTWGVVYEFVRVVTHPRVFSMPWTATAAWQFVDTLLAAPGLAMLTETERHRAVALEVFAAVPLLAGNVVHDAHTAVLMREHGVGRIYTRDTAFHRFPFLEVVDPLAP
ncbi:MAG TPA: VapC toxin family PIN domain ribonuclease [Planctomycetes bacterium]|nr:VapC toxin family PIN domain ribonuclease [Planctomycetota bacterium]